MFGSVKKAMKLLESVVKRLDTDRLSRKGSLQLFECFAKIERLAAAGKAMCGLQVAVSNAWWDTGERSPAHYLAAKSGTSVGRAVSVLNTTSYVYNLPATEDAFRRGKLSERQVEEIVSAASLNQEAEAELLEIAEWEALETLRRKAERVRAAARSDAERHKYLHRHRQLRHWIDIEGTFRLDGRFTPEAGAVIWSALMPLKNKALRSKDKEPDAAYAADALVELARRSCGSSSDPLRPGPQSVVHVRVDYAALERGELKPGEICEVPGVGPISVAAAQAFACDSFLKAVVMNGQDVRAVSHVGRTIPERLRTAIVERDTECVVPGCCETEDLEFDHIIPFARGGPVSLANIALLCEWHHYLKTYQGHVLARKNGRWLWYGPEGPPRDDRGPQQELVAAPPPG